MCTSWPPAAHMSPMRRPKTPAPKMVTGRPAVVGGVQDVIFSYQGEEFPAGCERLMKDRGKIYVKSSYKSKNRRNI
jgi:hypothetical protein